MSFIEKYEIQCGNVDKSPSKVLRELNMSTALYSQWKNSGQTPRDTTLRKLADYFNVSVDYFKEDRVQPDDKLTQQDNDYLRNIPVYESVSAGFGVNASDYVLSYTPVFIHSDLEAENTIGIRVSGSSMYPKIEDGDIIIVLKSFELVNKKIAVINVDDSYFVKQILIEGDTVTLHSLNPEYQDRVFNGDERNKIKPVGLVKKIIKDA